MLPISPEKVFKVVEVSNRALRELYCFTTDEVIFEAIAAFRRSPSPAVTHWRKHVESIEFHSIAFDLSFEQACAVIAEIESRPAPEGWRYVIDDAEGEKAAAR